MKIPLRRTVALTIAAVTMATTSGCFGSFNATRKMWTFNRDASKNKFVQELVFLGMNVVPVYGIAAFVDVIGANAVEFWTGTNPITMAGRTRIDGKTSVESAVTEKNGVRTMEVKGFENDHLAWTTTMNAVRGTDLMEFKTVFATGRIVSRVIALDKAGNPYLISNSDNSP